MLLKAHITTRNKTILFLSLITTTQSLFYLFYQKWAVADLILSSVLSPNASFLWLAELEHTSRVAARRDGAAREDCLLKGRSRFQGTWYHLS